MFRMNGHVSLCLIIVAATVSILCGGCGSGGSNSNVMSQAQAQAVIEQVSEAVAQALENAFSSGEGAVRGVRPSLSTVVRSIQPDQSSGCTPSGSGENCNWPISYDGACPQGGTIAVAGDIDATLNGAGSGSVSSQVTITPANCAVSSLVISGDPNIGVGINMNFTDSAPVFPITLTEAGGISYGPNPSGSCKLNVIYTITSETSCTITGTVCGQSVNGSC
jgi:hypothetical protein